MGQKPVVLVEVRNEGGCPAGDLVDACRLEVDAFERVVRNRDKNQPPLSAMERELYLRFLYVLAHARSMGPIT